MTFNIALVLFPDFEELDFAGPYEVFGMTAKYIDNEWNTYTVAATPEVRAASAARRPACDRRRLAASSVGRLHQQAGAARFTIRVWPPMTR